MAVSVLGLAASVNCGGGTESPTGGSGTTSGTTSGTGTDTGTGTGGTTPGGDAVPPGPPTNGATPDGATSTTFAVRKLYLGDTKPDGTPDTTNGWKYYGYDLDGKASTATSKDLCKPRNNANPKTVYPDGNGGADNSFGKIILPIILGLSADASSKVNEGFEGGKFTIMLDLQKLGTGANYTNMMAQLYAGGDLGATPKWDGTDVWPVRPELLKDGATIAGGSVIQFPMSYVNDNTWVSGTKGNVTLSLSISGFTLNLTISSAWLSFKMDAAHKTATGGMIAGVLSTEVLISELQKVAGAFDPSFCDPTNPAFASIAAEIEQASDILKDGTQDPTKECDGISIGIGFDAQTVQLGTVLPKSDPGPNPCGDGGV